MLDSIGNGHSTDEWMQENVLVKIFDEAYAYKTPAEIKNICDKISRTCRECIEEGYLDE